MASVDVRFWPIAVIGSGGAAGAMLMSAFDPKQTLRESLMHFVRLGEFLAVSRISGPTHNLLQIRLDGTGSRPICERLPSVGGCSHKPLDEDALVRYVLEGVAEANGELGTAYSVAHIRYVENDTPPEVVYGFMAKRLIEHLHSGSEFVPGLSTES